MRFLVLLIAVALLAVACGPRTVVGKWSTTLPYAELTMELQDGGTAIATMRGEEGISLSTTGKWVYNSGMLSITWTDIDFENTPFDIREGLEQNLKTKDGEPVSGQVKWNNDGSFIWELPTGATTFRRA